jgi:hypothetical protein
MLNILKIRQDVLAHADAWAAEAIAIYGDDVDDVIDTVQPRYGWPERYAFYQLRKAIGRARH